MNAYDDHIRAVGFAGLQVAELQGVVQMTQQKVEEVAGVIAAATGTDPRNTDAQEALGMIAEMSRILGEQVGACEGIIARLNSYSNVF